MRSFLILLFILLPMACPGSASHAFNVTGRVITNGPVAEPVQGVAVTVKHKGYIIHEAQTGIDGRYTFKTDVDYIDIIFNHGNYAGKVLTRLHLSGNDFRIPDTELVPLKKECTVVGVSPALRKETEVYLADLRGDILAEKLTLISSQFAEEYHQLLATRSRDMVFDAATLVNNAVISNDQKIIQLLISQGMDVNIRDSDGNTPLHLAVYRGNEELAKMLMARAADVNAKNLRGKTPLHIASDKKNKDLILLLLEKGAYPFEMDNMGIMPLAESQIESSAGKDRFYQIEDGYALPVSSFTFSPSGRFLATCSEDGIIRIWNPTSGKLLGDLLPNRGAVTSLSFSPSGSYLASGSDDGTVVIRDLRDEQLHEQILSCSSPVRALCYSNEGRYLVSGCRDGNVRIWNALTKEIIKSSAVHEKPVTAMLITPDSNHIVTSSDDGTLKLTDFHDMKRAEVLYRHSRSICTFCFSPRGTVIASGDDTGEILMTDFFSGKVISRFKGHEGEVTGLLYSPGGRYLVSAGRDGILNYWDMLSGQKSLTVNIGNGAIKAVRFSPGGKYLVSGSENGAVTILESVSGNILATLVGFRDREWISLTPDLHFDSSLGGAHHILLQSKGEFVTLAQYWELLRSSKSVKECINGTVTSRKAISLPAPPQIRIISPSSGARSESGTVSLKVEVKGDCRIRDLQILLNGRPAKNEAVNEAAEDDRDTGKVRELTVETKLQLGLNKIEVVALSTDDVQSLPESVVVQYKYPHAVPSKRLFLLTVGVSEYGDPRLNLDSAALDAQEIGDFFKRMKGLLFEEVKTLALTDSAASSSSIIAAIKEIGRESTENDLVILFLAGHGVKNDRDEFFFLCHRGKLGELPANALSWNDFQQALLSLNAKNVLLLMDTCHSGSIFKPDEEFVSHDSLAEGLLGVAVFAACRGNESSREFPKLGGVFTQSLLSALQGKAHTADSRDDRITLFQAERYVSDIVPRITENKQHPLILRRDRVVDIPLSIFKAAL